MDALLGEGKTAAGWRSPRLAVTLVIALHVKAGEFPLLGVVAVARASDRLLTGCVNSFRGL